MIFEAEDEIVTSGREDERITSGGEHEGVPDEQI